MNRMNEPQPAAGAPAIIGSIVAFMSNLSSESFAHVAGGCAAVVGVAYTLWKWRRDLKRAEREDANEA